MEIQSVDRVIERMARACEGLAQPAIASDADGTLWRGDVGDDAFEALTNQEGVRETCKDALVAVADAAGLDTRGGATCLARRIYDAYKRGSFNEKDCFELMAWVFAGYSVDEVLSFASHVQERTNLGDRLIAEMQTIVDWSEQNGVEFWVVSASPQLVAQAAAARLGIAPQRVLGAAPVVQNGIVAPRMAGPMPYGPGKVFAIAQQFDTSQLIAAFGDSAFDLEMLSASRVPVAVEASRQLRQRAHIEPRLVQLAAPSLVAENE